MFSSTTGKSTATVTDVSDLQPTPELLKFYKGRINAFENERDDMLVRLEKISAKHAELHQTEWELKKRNEEVSELQKALSDAHTYLFEERDRLLALQAENDELKLQEIEDRRRIQHLLQLLQPSEQEVTFSRDAPPENMVMFARDASAQLGGGAHGAPQAHGKGDIPPSHMQQPPQPCERIMRTVFLPAANTESLILKIESLQAQLNEQKQFSEERIAALIEVRTGAS